MTDYSNASGTGMFDPFIVSIFFKFTIFGDLFHVLTEFLQACYITNCCMVEKSLSLVSM